MLSFQEYSLKEKIECVLNKWKILGFSELMDACEYKKSKAAFSQLISRCIKDNLLTSFEYRPLSRKFYQLTHGQDYNSNNRLHDAAVGITAFKLLKAENVLETNITRPNFGNSKTKFSDNIDEDGSFIFKKENELFTLAFEIELSRKSNNRILAKYEKYQFNSMFSLCFYIFDSINLLNKYRDLYKDFCDKQEIESGKRMILFCHANKILSNNTDLLNMSCYDCNRSYTFGEYLQN